MLRRRSHLGSQTDFGNLPFSSAIKANGYPLNIQHQQLQNLKYAEHSRLPLHTFENEALGRAYLSFRDASLQMIADGASAIDILGSPDYVNLDLFFRERLPEDGHSVSTFTCEIMKNLANPDIFAKLAAMCLLAPMMRVCHCLLTRSKKDFILMRANSGFCFRHQKTTQGYRHSCVRYQVNALSLTAQP